MRTTRDQLLSAEAAYNVTAQGHGFAQAMLIPLESALDAALADLPEPGPVRPLRLTQAMADTAEEVYDTHARANGQTECSRSVLEVALKAALAEVDPADLRSATAPEPAPAMTRAEALELAVKTTDHLAEPVMNGRGYVADGWKAPTLADRTAAIRDLVAVLLGEER